MKKIYIAGKVRGLKIIRIILQKQKLNYKGKGI